MNNLDFSKLDLAISKGRLHADAEAAAQQWFSALTPKLVDLIEKAYVCGMKDGMVGTLQSNLEEWIENAMAKEDSKIGGD